MNLYMKSIENFQEGDPLFFESPDARFNLNINGNNYNFSNNNSNKIFSDKDSADKMNNFSKCSKNLLANNFNLLETELKNDLNLKNENLGEKLTSHKTLNYKFNSKMKNTINNINDNLKKNDLNFINEYFIDEKLKQNEDKAKDNIDIIHRDQENEIDYENENINNYSIHSNNNQINWNSGIRGFKNINKKIINNEKNMIELMTIIWKI